MPDGTIGGETFNVLVEGAADAPPLLISNSLGTNLHMWDAQIPELARRFRVIRYDSRGHGRSVAGPGPYSLDRLGRDALAIADAVGAKTFHFLGLSKGGMVGQWLLAHAPERLDRTILANTAAHFASPDVWNERIATVKARGMAAITPGVIQRWFTPAFQQRDRAETQRIADMLAATPPEGYVACCAAIRDMDSRWALRGVKGKPVLVVIGDADPATPPAAGQLIADSIEGARAVTLPAAHLSNIEQPAAFNRAVVEFLSAGGHGHG